MHASGAEGWVEGAELVFRSKMNSADYHNEMNSEHFMEWFTRQLLPNIQNNSVIVLDNTADIPQQTKRQTPYDCNQNEKWLDKHKFPYDDRNIKKNALGSVNTAFSVLRL